MSIAPGEIDEPGASNTERLRFLPDERPDPRFDAAYATADAARTFENLVTGDDLLPAASIREKTRKKRRAKTPTTW